MRDLRRDRYDRSQSQADIVVENMTPDGVPVLVDIGVTHSLLLSYARAAAQRGELDAEGASERAHAANIYANKKNKRYNKIITEKKLDLNSTAAHSERAARHARGRRSRRRSPPPSRDLTPGNSP